MKTTVATTRLLRVYSPLRSHSAMRSVTSLLRWPTSTSNPFDFFSSSRNARELTWREM